STCPRIVPLHLHCGHVPSRSVLLYADHPKQNRTQKLSAAIMAGQSSHRQNRVRPDFRLQSELASRVAHLGSFGALGEKTSRAVQPTGFDLKPSSAPVLPPQFWAGSLWFVPAKKIRRHLLLRSSRAQAKRFTPHPS